MFSADFYIFQHRITTENWIINLVNKNFQQSQQIKQFIKYYLAPRSQVRTKRSLFDSTVRPEIQLKARPGPHPPTNRRPCPRRWKCRLPRWHHVWKFRLSVRHRARIQEKRGSGGRGVPHVALIAVVVGVISFRDLYIVFVPRKTFARGDFPRTWGRRSVCFFFFCCRCCEFSPGKFACRFSEFVLDVASGIDESFMLDKYFLPEFKLVRLFPKFVFFKY